MLVMPERSRLPPLVIVPIGGGEPSPSESKSSSPSAAVQADVNGCFERLALLRLFFDLDEYGSSRAASRASARSRFASAFFARSLSHCASRLAGIAAFLLFFVIGAAAEKREEYGQHAAHTRRCAKS
jgi:hypothetical protein